MVAPIAPKAEASVTVAIPKKIDPRTRNINAAGGIISINALITSFRVASYRTQNHDP